MKGTLNLNGPFLTKNSYSPNQSTMDPNAAS
ncbi:hypothetical protein CLW00_10658 [Mongoliibacter ruber]|uniref:Uncharacterized protein n=1 Tax=Mongoliibacter ruber TaxID=1750599 RepID=A0A2T0WL55_9BACT|nr:hypothetical protein CLW00_10658 [Mongoliibacter ruber]